MPTKKVAKRVCVTTDTVKVARFGSEPVSVKVTRGSSVSDALAKAGVNLSGTDKVYIDGARANQNDMVKSGDILTVISPKAAGYGRI